MPSRCPPKEPLPSFLHIICKTTEVIPLLKQRQLEAQQLARSLVPRQPAAPMTLTELAKSGVGFYQLPRKHKSVVIGPIGRPNGIGFGEPPPGLHPRSWAVSPVGEFSRPGPKPCRTFFDTVGLVQLACYVS